MKSYSESEIREVAVKCFDKYKSDKKQLPIYITQLKCNCCGKDVVAFVCADIPMMFYGVRQYSAKPDVLFSCDCNKRAFFI